MLKLNVCLECSLLKSFHLIFEAYICHLLCYITYHPVCQLWCTSQPVKKKIKMEQSPKWHNRNALALLPGDACSNPDDAMRAKLVVGGMACSLFPVGHSDTTQSWLSVNSRIRKRVATNPPQLVAVV